MTRLAPWSAALLGRDHALSGAVVFAALIPVLHPTATQVATGAVITAGAGVLPDIDHPDSTVSRTFGFLTRAFAWIVEKLSGGHRHGTHSIIGVAIFTAGTWFAGRYQLSAPMADGHPVLSWHTFPAHLLPAGLLLALLCSAALRALRIGGHAGDLLGMAAAAAIIYWNADQAAFTSRHIPLLTLAVAVGTATHIAGDMLTHGGCPLFYPLSKDEIHLLPAAARFTTGKMAEHWIVSPLLLAGLAVLLWHDAPLINH